MYQIVSFSGGRTSAYLCFILKQLFPHVIFIFMDTGAEHPETYDFIRKVNIAFGLNLICIRVKPHEKLGKGVSYEEININDLKQDYEGWKRMLEK